MSGETEGAPSGWTVDTLLAHLNARMTARDAHLDERHDTQTREVAKALAVLDTRFLTANEFRDQTRDILATNATKVELAAIRDGLDARLGVLERSNEHTQGQDAGATEARTGLRLDSGWFIGLIGVAAGIAIALTR